MLKPLVIENGHIIDPGQGIDEIGILLIAEGKISCLGKENPSLSRTDYDLINADGLIVCPGFIDLHCHLRQPGFEEKESIATGTRAAAKGGFTTICCMPNTNPPTDTKTIIDYVKSITENEGVVRVLSIGCISKYRQGKELTNLNELASAGVVGFSDDGDPITSSRLMLEAMQQSRSTGLPIIDHCEDKNLAQNSLGNDTASALAEEIIVARDLSLARSTGARLHICHVSVAGSVDLIRTAKDRGINVTAEVTPHHLTLTDKAVAEHGTNAKVNPPLRTKEDIRSLIQGLKDNVIDIVATDHAPHTETDKKHDFAKAAPGISVFETALGSLMSLVHGEQLTLNTIIAKLTIEPARILGGKYGQLGTLAVDAPADLAILDPDIEWTVDPSTFLSKGKNPPLSGATLKGKVMATLFQGNLVYRDDMVHLE